MRVLSAPLAGLVLLVRPAAPTDLSTADLVAAAAAYVAHYEEQLTSVIADETSTQNLAAYNPRREHSQSQSRRMRSEIFFMFEPLERRWMAIRDVLEVDGNPVEDRPDLKEALRTLPVEQVGTTFKMLNSRFNIGTIARNFNEPTLSLLVLDRNHRGRFRFDKKSVERQSGISVVTLEFVEKERPTLIAGMHSGAAFSKGHIVLEESGRVRHVVLNVKADQVKVNLTTDYRPDSKLGIWVPAAFQERYEYGDIPPRLGKEFQVIQGETIYSNYRQFEVRSRIK